MRFAALVLVCAAVALAGCGITAPRTTRSYGPTDFGANPMIVFDGSTPREQLSLRGVKLGDPKTAIRASRIENQTKDGWVVCSDRCKYRVADGTVVTLGLWDPAAIKKLQINSESDVQTRLGKAEKTDTIDVMTRFTYGQGHVSVIWNKFEGQVNAINVSR